MASTMPIFKADPQAIYQFQVAHSFSWSAFQTLQVPIRNVCQLSNVQRKQAYLLLFNAYTSLHTSGQLAAHHLTLMLSALLSNHFSTLGVIIQRLWRPAYTTSVNIITIKGFLQSYWLWLPVLIWKLGKYWLCRPGLEFPCSTGQRLSPTLTKHWGLYLVAGKKLDCKGTVTIFNNCLWTAVVPFRYQQYTPCCRLRLIY